MDDDRRLHSRHHAETQLEVFELHTDQRLGRVVDFSAHGFMLFSDMPLAADERLECRMVTEHAADSAYEITFGAECLWHRLSADGQHYWVGFHIINLADDQAAALEILLKHR